jgi:phenylacetate 2-hydroxylase
LLDVDHFGPDASTFNPERWLTSDGTLDPASEKASTGIQHFSFGAGSRACSGQLIASRLLYTALVRLICSYRVIASDTQPPNTDYVDYNQFKSALVAIPRDFKVRLIPRDGIEDASESGTLERCLEEARMRTEGYYKEEVGVRI